MAVGCLGGCATGVVKPVEQTKESRIHDMRALMTLHRYPAIQKYNFACKTLNKEWKNNKQRIMCWNYAGYTLLFEAEYNKDSTSFQYSFNVLDAKKYGN